MITTARLENFKGLRDLKIPALRRITLLGGQNNVGKTSVLEALFWFHDRLNPALMHRHFAWRGIGTLPVEPEFIWAPTFRNYDMNLPVSVTLTDNGNIEQMTVRFTQVAPTVSLKTERTETNGMRSQIETGRGPLPSFRLDFSYTAPGQAEQVSHLEFGANGLRLRVEHAEGHPRPATFLAARAPVNPLEDANRFGRLDVLGRQDRVVDFLRVIEPRLRSLSSVAVADQSLVHGDVGLGRKLPVALMGDGMARTLSLILAIATTPRGLVLLDEAENGIHHSVMAKVWESTARAAVEFDCQLVATTHSYECLQAAAAGLAAADRQEDFCYVRLDREGTDIVAKTYTHAMVVAACERGWEIR